jgi:hypothetical protein
MKTKFKLLILALCVGALTALGSCDKDDDGGGLSDPNEFCDGGLCSSSDAKKQQCIDSYNTCMAGSPDSKDDECAGLALLICG